MSQNMFNVDDETIRKTLEKEKTTVKQLNHDKEIIKNWIKTQPHLPEVLDDHRIRNFILLNKNSIENTKQKIDNYYTLRSKIPELFDYANPKLPGMKQYIAETYCFAHPTPIDGLYRSMWIKLKDPSYDLMHREFGMYIVNIGEVRMAEDRLIEDIWIIDMKPVSLSDITSITPTLALKLLAIYEKIFSLRVKAAYFVNCPTYITMLSSLLKTILKPKIFERLHFLQNDDILKTILPSKDLPKDYGGQGPTLEELHQLTVKTIEKFQSRFDELDKLRVNEKLRPEKLRNDDILGFHGNFKKLNVD